MKMTTHEEIIHREISSRKPSKGGSSKEREKEEDEKGHPGSEVRETASFKLFPQRPQKHRKQTNKLTKNRICPSLN